MFYWVLKKVVLGPLLNLLFRPWVEGDKHVPRSGGAILASNHLSFSDSIFLPLVLERRITFPAKMEYFTGTGVKGRLTAAFFRGVGQIPIDRSGGSASEAAIQAGLRVLGRGELFGIYPEGTRSPDGRLYKGKTGVARMALEAKVPVLPVAMIDTDKAQPTGTVIPKIMRVGVRIGRPMDFSRYEGMEDDRFILRSITDEVMYELMLLSGQEYVDVYASSVKDRFTARAKEIGSGAAALAHHLQEEAAARIERVQQRRAASEAAAAESAADEPASTAVDGEAVASPSGSDSRLTGAGRDSKPASA
ncbi:lysophospholipid acyltransferase family protein [Luteipulveratus flavus]|uniref:Lysophospholipid acyltransferase family protein n=1 Tax=Luteipulveratus flavus TaxID=3031728 RepID=A0ABT6CB95_9MICO|nr:lysophospholipid acyltransferase family protein [Luteipulveratus sp. YIM 133296]MDF8265798.1 lysophospholipid acyltransferase family protein [Luteipulveratus sp. YIM 133296]